MPNGPLTVVIFGASGDLAARKLVPALYRLQGKGRLPEDARVVGVARSPFSDDAFRDKMAGAVREFAPKDFRDDAWAAFARKLHYAAGDAGKPGGLDNLRGWLERLEGSGGGRRLYYLSVSPELYGDIARNMAEAGLNRPPDGADPADVWRRLIVEKPFGRDLETCKALNATLRQHFKEDQIYRIDHYLGKETVQNILVFRFANTLFEPLWNHNFIDHVQISVGETVTVKNRAEYYDKSGVLRDMFQNHLLQLLTLVAMEAPSRYSADTLRNEKVKLLDAVQVHTVDEAAANMVTAQYAGYRQEKGVAAGSKTPTFAAVQLKIDNWRWRGVPFFLRSGKALNSRTSEIVIQFRCPPHLMFPLPPGETLQCNRLSLSIQPDEAVRINFQTKVPDTDKVKLRPADLKFQFYEAYGSGALPEAYERLLQDAVHGDAHLFMRSDEIERSWEIMDPFIAAAEGPQTPEPPEYAVGSTGPANAEKFLEATGRKWLTLCGV